MADVLAEIDGLDAEAREARLQELAQDEDGLVWYTSVSGHEDYADAFSDRFGISVETYRGSVDEVRQRVIQEASADASQADVVQLNDSGIYALSDEGLLDPYDQGSPALAAIDEIHRTEDDWVWGLQIAIVAGWNTDAVDDPPTTWEEFLPVAAGRGGWEPRSYYWFATLVNDYFVGQLGYTQEDAIALFTDAAAGAVAVQGNPTLFQFLVAGEVPYILHTYLNYFATAAEVGAPVAWEPAITPIPVQPHALALVADSGSPASALLWFDWWLTDGQQIVADQGLWTVNLEYATDAQRRLQDDTLPVTRDYVTDPDGTWGALYDEVLAGVGRTASQ